MLKHTLTFLLTTIILSSCLINSRIGYNQQAETKSQLNINSGNTLLLLSIPFDDQEYADRIANQLLKLNAVIEPRKSALSKGIDIPAYIPPEEVDQQLSNLSANGTYDYLIIADGYPVATEYNGGNLVSTIIEVWDIDNKESIYNSHSTVKSKDRSWNRGETWIVGEIFNDIFAPPISEDKLYLKGMQREIRKLNAVLN